MSLKIIIEEYLKNNELILESNGQEQHNFFVLVGFEENEAGENDLFLVSKKKNQ
jgi:hypothetical protein